MFAPETTAFEFLGITIWHHDPCTDNTDDSCGWSRPKLTKKEQECADGLIDNDFDNLRMFFGNQQIRNVGEKSFFEDVSHDDMKGYIYCIFRHCKKVNRKWWQHPKWHFWHWRICIRWKWLKFSFGKPERKSSLMEDINW